MLVTQASRIRARAKGVATRGSILAAAVHLASVEGLANLTIGRLASEVGMSKSGLFAHFGSKEDLQLATVEAARSIAAAEVLRPALAAGDGLRRAWRLVDRWLGSIERGVFRGGCFFAAASAEFDGRPGPVRDRIAAVMRDWLSAVERALEAARRGHEISEHVDPAQLAFELNALVLGANWARQLHSGDDAITRARRAILERLRSAATASAPSLPLPPAAHPVRSLPGGRDSY